MSNHHGMMMTFLPLQHDVLSYVDPGFALFIYNNKYNYFTTLQKQIIMSEFSFSIFFYLPSARVSF